MSNMLVTAMVCVAALAPGAPEQGTLTIIGTPEGVTVFEPGHAPEHYTPRDLRLLNQERLHRRPAPLAEAEAEPERARRLPEPVDEPPPEPEERELTPEQLAEKRAAMAEVQALRQLGGAYFYTEDDRPVSQAELTRMLESGDMQNLKVVDLFQQRRLYDFEAIEKGEPVDGAQ